MPNTSSDKSNSTATASLGWVRFLRNYGPLPTNGNLFDEYVDDALRRAKVAPIVLSSSHFDAMVSAMNLDSPPSLLIAGTAGDGKTFHLRRLWLQLGGSTKGWLEPGPLKTLRTGNGHEVMFVTDLSALSDTESDQILEGLENSVAGQASTRYVIATNHGQVLERMRALGVRRGRPAVLRSAIQDVFLQSGEGPTGLKIFDLSRTAHRQSLKEVLEAVTNHQGWDSCKECSLDSSGRVCPIAENRRRVIGQDDGARLSERLCDLVEVSRLNGSHLPIRDLLALVTNMILGHKDARDGLMTCLDVPKIQESGALDRGSVYDNIFGANLPGRRATSGGVLPVFKTLLSYGIGEETANGIDGLLVYGSDDSRLAETFAALIGNDSIYGGTVAFKSFQDRYLEGEEDARLEHGASEFLERLVIQRRRLFFTLPKERADYPYWNLTAFRFAGDYLALTEALAMKKNVDERTRAVLAQGLNRVMTGLLIDNQDKLFVASSGGFTQSKISVLCEAEVPSRRTGGVGMSIRYDGLAQRPCIDVALPPGGRGSVILGLTPVRFEFLCRVAEGALPGSFSNECLEDLLAFKARLLRLSEILKASLSGEADEDLPEEDESLRLTFIEIEQTGHGYCKPVSMRSGV